jgi:hypothetical protein
MTYTKYTEREKAERSALAETARELFKARQAGKANCHILPWKVTKKDFYKLTKSSLNLFLDDLKMTIQYVAMQHKSLRELDDQDAAAYGASDSDCLKRTVIGFYPQYFYEKKSCRTLTILYFVVINN